MVRGPSKRIKREQKRAKHFQLPHSSNLLRVGHKRNAGAQASTSRIKCSLVGQQHTVGTRERMLWFYGCLSLLPEGSQRTSSSFTSPTLDSLLQRSRFAAPKCLLLNIFINNSKQHVLIKFCSRQCLIPNYYCWKPNERICVRKFWLIGLDNFPTRPRKMQVTSCTYGRGAFSTVTPHDLHLLSLQFSLWFMKF